MQGGWGGERMVKENNKSPSFLSIEWYHFFSFCAFTIGIIALFLGSVLYTNNNGSAGNLERQIQNISDRLEHLQMENSLLQSQFVEIEMQLGTETILQEGTYIWSIGGQANTNAAQSCFPAVEPNGFLVSNPGSGYFVGDLVTVGRLDISPVTYTQNAVLKITSVGLAGEVTGFQLLYRGCLSSFSPPPGIVNITTLCIRGTGFTVTRVPGIPFFDNDGNHYQFPGLAPLPKAPLQYANYSLRSLTIESVTYTILHLFPPEFPIVVVDTFSTSGSFALNVALLEFTPRIPELQSTRYLLPLTRKNYNALNLTDDDNCYQNNVECWLDASVSGLPRFQQMPRAVRVRYSELGANLQHKHSWFAWYFVGKTTPNDWVTNNAVLTLNAPLMFVLPTI
jgi:hypothetical protein